MFNISEFIEELNANGTQHNSHFSVTITLPSILLGKSFDTQKYNATYSDTASVLTLRAESVIEPGIALRSTAINRYGVGLYEKVPYSAAFTDTNITFINDADGYVQMFWYSWLNLINNFSDTKELFGTDYKQYTCSYKEDIVSTININKYDKGGRLIYTMVLNNAYPTSMNDNMLSWMDNNISKTVVGLTFKDWHYEKTLIGAG